MLRDIIEQSGKSVYRVSKDSGVPYTTLNELLNGKKDPAECSVRTLARLAAYYDMSMDMFYRQLQNSASAPVPADTWNAARLRRYRFPVICASNGFDVSRVHPLMQRDAVRIHDLLRGDGRVVQAVLFGSSVNIRCNKDSDLDLMLGLRTVSPGAKDEISERIQASCSWNADILWADRVQPGSRLYENVMRGVRLI